VYAGGRRRPGSPDLAHALADARAERGFVWIGLSSPTEAEFAELAERFALPQLAVDDAIRAHQRPKLERYDGVTFAVVKPVRYVDREEVVELSELALFLGEHFIVTVRHGVTDVPATVRHDLEADPEVLSHGAASVLYRCLDLVVDEYLAVVRQIGEDVDEIEEQVFGGVPGEHAERIYKLKREVLEFRRAVAPLTEPINRLTSGRLRLVPEELKPYFSDVQDHLLREAEHVEGLDLLLTGALNANLANVGVRQNEDMRKISAWVAIIAVPTAIAGIYGMNFEFVPELEWRYGYPFALGLMVVCCLGLYRSFKRRGWL
jgi:magnesium transporter